MDAITVIVNIVFGLACAGVPVYFGYKSKLYHFAVLGAVVCIAVIFFPYGMILSALCAGLFYFMIKKEVKTREEMARRKKVKEAERKLAENGEDRAEQLKTSFNRNDIWPPVNVDLPSEIEEDEDTEDEEISE